VFVSVLVGAVIVVGAGVLFVVGRTMARASPSQLRDL
jgi:hypothetical protein